uniref:Uncharacterized protein n=1 Tax=Steinernema glaseri TaxID=37863 RepID=A0A1I7Z020_9BILA
MKSRIERTSHLICTNPICIHHIKFLERYSALNEPSWSSRNVFLLVSLCSVSRKTKAALMTKESCFCC